jgi:hypothetical protein
VDVTEVNFHIFTLDVGAVGIHRAGPSNEASFQESISERYNLTIYCGHASVSFMGCLCGTPKTGGVARGIHVVEEVAGARK